MPSSCRRGERELDVAADWKLIVEQWLEGAPAARGRYLAPNQLIEVWQGGAAVLRVMPVAPGRSRLIRLDYGMAGTKGRGGRKNEQLDAGIAQQVELAESIQTGLAAAGDDFTESGR